MNAWHSELYCNRRAAWICSCRHQVTPFTLSLRGSRMKFGSILERLRNSFRNSAGTIVFGMEDGTVSIFGLIFGVAATTTETKTVLIAGATGAVAAAVSMMAG